MSGIQFKKQFENCTMSLCGKNLLKFRGCHGQGKTFGEIKRNFDWSEKFGKDLEGQGNIREFEKILAVAVLRNYA